MQFVGHDEWLKNLIEIHILPNVHFPSFILCLETHLPKFGNFEDSGDANMVPNQRNTYLSFLADLQVEISWKT